MNTIKGFFLTSIALSIIIACTNSRQVSGSEGVVSPGKNKGIAIDSPAIERKSTPTLSPEEKIRLQKKYAEHMGLAPEAITHIKLYQFIDKWLNTPYLWGGTDERGIDCSAFIQKLFDYVYKIYIPRTSVDQFFAKWVDKFGSRTKLSEGDLVFFRTMPGKLISHVGVYLGNRRFINSSSNGGVTFGNLDSPYWKSKYAAAGRIKQGMLSKMRRP